MIEWNLSIEVRALMKTMQDPYPPMIPTTKSKSVEIAPLASALIIIAAKI